MFIWFILCESCSRRAVSEDLSQFDEEGRSWEKGEKKWQLPFFHQKHTLSHISASTQRTYAHTHIHRRSTPTLALTLVCSCYLHFRRSTGLSAFDLGDQLSQVELNLTGAHTSTKKTSKSFLAERFQSKMKKKLPESHSFHVVCWQVRSITRHTGNLTYCTPGFLFLETTCSFTCFTYLLRQASNELKVQRSRKHKNPIETEIKVLL